MKRYILITICMLAVFGANCQTVVKNSIEYKSVTLGEGDKTFLALKDTAQKHLQTFIDGLKKHRLDLKNYRFDVKSDFVQNGNHEHMWSAIYEYKDGYFKGVFIDSAFTVKKMKMGQKVIINRNEIEDWSIENINTGKIIGQFSVKYLDSKKE